jgi:DNA primase small subunit
MSQTEQFVRQKFQQYYLGPGAKLALPPRMEEREYGFLLFKEKFMVRHRGFKTQESLMSAVRDLVPAHVYFSTAYYQDPTAPMEQKGWQGADLVFDIDADHLETPCKPSHDSWKCKACQSIGHGTTPKVCPKCKNDRFEEQTWLCEKCLHHAKEETSKLLEMLFSDFGLDPANTRTFFSGHRGYHVHAYSQELSKLGEAERKDIVDYVLGQGLQTELHDLYETPTSKIRIVEGPQMGQPGWRGRMVQGIYDLLGEPTDTLGISSAQEKAVQALDREGLFRRPFWSSVKGVGLPTWKTLALKAVQKRSAKIDTVVTTDIHRLIRLPGTLNGHTGLLATRVSTEELDKFDPFAESLVFNGDLKIRVKNAPEFRIGDKHYGPYHDEVVELPAAAAMLLLCKRRGEPA